MPDPLRGFLRHTLATLAYRAVKPLRGAPPSFETFRAAPGTRSAGEILAHLIDLLDWALSMAQGQPRWKDSQPLPWGQGTARYFAALRTLDDFLASSEPLQISPEKLFQGPIADALTHVGQLALLRRAAAAPVRGENYYLADIVPGRVGLDQAPPVREFD